MKDIQSARPCGGIKSRLLNYGYRCRTAVILDAEASQKHTPRRKCISRVYREWVRTALSERGHTLRKCGKLGAQFQEGGRQGNKREFVRKYAEEKLRGGAIINLDETKQAFRIILTTTAARMFATYCRNIRHLFRVFQNVRIRVRIRVLCVRSPRLCQCGLPWRKFANIFERGRRLDLGRSRPPMNGL